VPLSLITVPRRRLLLLALPLLIAFSLLFLIRQITQRIILFESILLSILLTVVLVFSYFALECKREISQFSYEKFLSVFVSLLLFYSISFSTVLNTDRSKSLYVLSWVHDLGPITEKNLSQKIRMKYGEYDSSYIQQRIIEHKSRGVFVERNGLIQTSSLGNAYWYVANKIAGMFKLSGWYSAKIEK
jgi:hypothetical protein